MKNNALQISFATFLLGATTVLLSPLSVEAKSIAVPLHAPTWYLSCPWINAYAWMDVVASLSYYANIRNVDTGTLLADGDMVPVGTHIRLEPKPYQNAETDISWFASGGEYDSPYGSWSQNAAYTGIGEAADAGIPANESCAGQDASFIGWSGLSLAVHPPTPQYSFSGGGCSGTSADCVVSSIGPITAAVTFPATHYTFYENGSSPAVPPYLWSGDGLYSVLSDSVAAQSISYTLTAVGSEPPPNPPTITGNASGNQGSLQTFHFVATDPSGHTIRYGIDWNNDKIVDEYAPAMGYIPTGTSSSAPHTIPSTGTTYSFEARTENSNGVVSTWTSYTMAINQAKDGSCGVANGTSLSSVPTIGLCADGAASSVTGSGPWAWTCSGTNGGASVSCATAVTPPTATLTATPLSVASGARSTLSWSSTNATSCTAGGPWSNADTLSGSGLTNPLTADTTFTFQCTGLGGTSALQSVTVTVTSLPAVTPTSTPEVSITATPNRVISGDSTDLAWDATDVNSCTISRNGVQNWKSLSADAAHTIKGSTSDIVTSQTTYVISCTSTSGAVVSSTEIVNLLSSFQEF